MRKVLLVLLVVLIIGVIAADRVGVAVAQDQIAKQVAAKSDLPSKPDVKIHGIPFLTQAIGGDYKKIDVQIGRLTRQGVTLEDVKVELADVKAPLRDVVNGDASNVVAGTATASAIVPYDTVRRRAPAAVKSISANGSDLQVRGNMSILGFSGDVTIVAAVRATGQGIGVTPQSVRSGGGPAIPLALLRDRFTFNVPVRDLPLGSRISKVEVTPDGLRIAATADDVKLSEVPKS
jgi:LmeA-like phospholipid-binding